MASWITKASLWTAAISFVVGTIFSYFISSNTDDFLFYTFCVAIGATSQVAVNCVIVFILETKGKD